MKTISVHYRHNLHDVMIQFESEQGYTPEEMGDLYNQFHLLGRILVQDLVRTGIPKITATIYSRSDAVKRELDTAATT